MQVKQLVVGRRRIDLEIACVDDDAERCRNRQSHCADNGVRYANELNLKGAERDLIVWLYPVQLGFFEQFVLFEPPLDQSQGERSPVDREFDLREQKRNTTDVVFMPVRENKPSN